VKKRGGYITCPASDPGLRELEQPSAAAGRLEAASEERERERERRREDLRLGGRGERGLGGGVG
jgi:hypothetical protein